MKKKIVVLGASEYVNPLILKAKEMGFETHTFAWETGDIGEHTSDYFYPISLWNKEAILEKCIEIQPAGIVTLGSDMASVTAAYLSEKLRLPGNSYEKVKCATNKLSFRRMLEKEQILQPRFIGIADSMSGSDSKNIGFPMVVKPSDRSASRGVKKIFNRAELFKGIVEAREISKEGKVIVEEYIQGRHFSCECISIEGVHHILAYTKRLNKENYKSFIEHIYEQPAGLTEKQKREIKNVVNKVLDTVGMKNGASSVEIFLGANEEVYVLEAGMSMYGDFIATDLVEMSTGYDYMKMIIQIAVGDKVTIEDEKNAGRYFRIKIILSKEDLSELESMLTEKSEKVRKYKLFVDEEDVPDKVDNGRYGFYVYECE